MWKTSLQEEAAQAHVLRQARVVSPHQLHVPAVLGALCNALFDVVVLLISIITIITTSTITIITIMTIKYYCYYY